jgi:hypothetical protein
LSHYLAFLFLYFAFEMGFLYSNNNKIKTNLVRKIKAKGFL